jgi:hypothetical protein
MDNNLNPEMAMMWSVLVSSVDAGKELDQQRCLQLESLKYPYYVVANVKLVMRNLILVIH